MFTKQNNEKKLSEIATVIGTDTTIEGTLHVNSSIRIDGKVLGEVKCSGDVTVGKDGHVEHQITARNLYIAGTVKGNVNVEEKIHIYESGYLEGKAQMRTIIIDENGQFRGESLMNGASASPKNVVKIGQEVEPEKKAKSN
ncbi:cytoskeletal protein CcmA (bactofilin family) [Evansella vedderi]|uniref:Cytoskeletal protein CcmA (Bactofilin family) n=1 Tax=Evansella vedderi TaxID=38282 RepID=A0ABU0A3M0_9BACI|nr:polymer-forming cytoskeletal protein [Evansella vedderi]MDQ0258092.1 cytoskeletal protein CcmA (bactofilin family) [Evansella vedderi]